VKGNVIYIDQLNNSGIIVDHEGNRYDFNYIDWKEKNQPSKGAAVDFKSINNTAIEIYFDVMSNSSNANIGVSRVTYILLGVFFWYTRSA
jgi:hypothetical protein